MFRVHKSKYTYPYSEFYHDKPLTVSPVLQRLRGFACLANYTFQDTGAYIIGYPSEAKSEKQGIKIHITDAEPALERITQFCANHDLTFKLPRDDRVYNEIMGKSADRAASGKWLTIYPPQDQWISIAYRLETLLADYQGPRILSDRRICGASIVHYRYGVFTGVEIDIPTPHGIETKKMLQLITGELVEDVRTPYFQVPPGVADPQPRDNAPDTAETEDCFLKDGRYHIQQSCHFSNTGGVYRAEDTHGQDTCIIKEARPYVAIDHTTGADAVTRLENEHKILEILASYNIAPKPRDLFFNGDSDDVDDEIHLFLAMEFIAGTPLSGIRPSPERIINIGIELARVLNILHNGAGVFIGDLTPSNVMLQDDDSIKLIDFEAGYTCHQVPTTLSTLGFAPPTPETRPGAADIYGFGALIIDLYCGITVMFNSHPQAADTCLRNLQKRGLLPEALRTLLNDCLSAEEAKRPTAKELHHRMKDIQNTQIPKVSVAPLDTERDAQTVHRLKSDVYRILQYIETVADFQNPVHCFPGCPEAFETNHHSLAYGAAGIGMTFKEIQTDNEALPRISKDISAWMRSNINLHGKYPIHTVVPPGLFIGRSGIALFLNAVGDPSATDMMHAAVKDAITQHHCQLPVDFFVGGTGIAIGALALYEQTKDPALLDGAIRIRHGIDTTAVSDPGLRGIAGIALLDLVLYSATGNNDYKQNGITHLHRIVSLPEDGWMNVSADIYGRAGIVSCLARYHHIFNEASVWIPKLLPPQHPSGGYIREIPTPGIQGLAGIGTAMLDVAHLVGDVLANDYLHAALTIADDISIFYRDKGKEAGIATVDPIKITPHLFSGGAGIAGFLCRLAEMIDDVACPQTASPLTFMIDDVLNANT